MTLEQLRCSIRDIVGGCGREIMAASICLGGSMAIATTHELLTGSWTTDVETLETAVGHFKQDAMKNDCQVVFFEVVRDRHLHVNVTHRYPTRTVCGWAGPANLAHGFVHNRIFADAQPSQIIRHVRDMVFAARI
jgi:hypothetical protein